MHWLHFVVQCLNQLRCHWASIFEVYNLCYVHYATGARNPSYNTTLDMTHTHWTSTENSVAQKSVNQKSNKTGMNQLHALFLISYASSTKIQFVQIY
jgi:hypothetical protein